MHKSHSHRKSSLNSNYGFYAKDLVASKKIERFLSSSFIQYTDIECHKLSSQHLNMWLSQRI